MFAEGEGLEDMRRKANGLAGALAAFSRPWRMLMARAGSVGVNEVASASGMWGLGFLFLFAAAGQSTALWVMFFAGLCSQAEHRLRSRRGRDTHSQGMGESNLRRVFGAKARHAEVLLAVGVGFACWEGEDRAGAIWFWLAALGHAMTVEFSRRRREVMEDSIQDSRIEMGERSYRRPAGRIVKPWDINQGE